MPSYQREARHGPNTIVSAVDWSTAGYNNGPYPVCIDVNASGQAVLCAVGKRPLGILQNIPKVGGMARYEKDGLLRFLAGAAIVAGQDLTVSATGALIPAVAGGGVIVGKSLYAAAAGEISTCDFFCYGGSI